MAERKTPKKVEYIAVRACTFNDKYYREGDPLSVRAGVEVPRHFKPANVAIKDLANAERKKHQLASGGRRKVKADAALKAAEENADIG